MEKKRKVQAVSIVVAVFIVILIIHTLQNLSDRMTPTSEVWSHAKEVGVSTSGKTPFISQGDDGNPVISFLAGGSLETVALKEDFELTREQIDINGVAISDFIIHDHSLLFSSGGKLFSGSIASNKLENVEQLSEESVLSLSFTQSSDVTYAAAALPSGIRIYRLGDDGIDEMVM